MPISEEEVEHSVEMLTRDLASTVAASRTDDAREFAASMRLEADSWWNDGIERFTERLVEHVQQAIMDEQVDTTWPACLRHPNHPLWFHDGAWFCDRDKIRLAALGDLSHVTLSRPRDGPPDSTQWRRRPKSP